MTFPYARRLLPRPRYAIILFMPHDVSIQPITESSSPLGFIISCACGWSNRVTSQSNAAQEKTQHLEKNPA